LDKYPNVMLAKDLYKVGVTRVGLVKREATPRCVSTVESASTEVHE
jgi:hypothetical protein